MLMMMRSVNTTDIEEEIICSRLIDSLKSLLIIALIKSHASEQSHDLQSAYTNVLPLQSSWGVFLPINGNSCSMLSIRKIRTVSKPEFKRASAHCGFSIPSFSKACSQTLILKTFVIFVLS